MWRPAESDPFYRWYDDHRDRFSDSRMMIASARPFELIRDLPPRVCAGRMRPNGASEPVDDRPFVHEAFESAPAGTQICLAEGNYYLGSTLRIGSEAHSLIADGDVLLCCLNELNGPLLSIDRASAPIAIRGFTIKAYGRIDPLIVVSNTRRAVRIEDLVIKGTAPPPLRLVKTHNSPDVVVTASVFVHTSATGFPLGTYRIDPDGSTGDRLPVPFDS